MSGDVVGSVMLSFPIDSALKIVEKFTGMKIDVNSEDFGDAIGELVNMISGAAKAKFEGKNLRGKLRDFLLHGEKRIHIDDDTAILKDSNVVFELRKIGVNLNQIAFKINVGDFPATEDLQLHLTQLQDIIRKELLG